MVQRSSSWEKRHSKYANKSSMKSFWSQMMSYVQLSKYLSSILFYFILFYFILFYFILCYFMLFYFMLFYFMLFYLIYFILKFDYLKRIPS